MRKFHIYDINGNKYTSFAEKILYVDDKVIIVMIKDNLSSVINVSNIVAIIEILDQHSNELIKQT
jgi:hypothetical protein